MIKPKLIIVDIPYLPKPNQVELYLTSELPPSELTTTAFVVPVNGDQVVLADNTNRGVEIPGGHIEPGETMAEAAKREALEETGVVVHGLVPIGYLKMTITADKPSSWKYPYPVSYQQFFAGTAAGRPPRKRFASLGEPCGDPVFVTNVNLYKLSRSAKYFIAEARRVLNK